MLASKPAMKNLPYKVSRGARKVHMPVRIGGSKTLWQRDCVAHRFKLVSSQAATRAKRDCDLPRDVVQSNDCAALAAALDAAIEAPRRKRSEKDANASAAGADERADHDTWMSRIGNTPLLQVGNSSTYVKLEGHNPSGSIKDRALSSMVTRMLDDGRLRLDGDTLCLVTSGSAGLSLFWMHQNLPENELDVLIVMPESYAHKTCPAEIIATEGVEVHRSLDSVKQAVRAAGGASGARRVLLMDGLFIDVLAEAKEFVAREDWKILDQHHDDNGMKGHEATAQELMRQLPTVTDVVCTTGTGATAAGLRRYLPPHVRVHSRPGASGAIDGLSDVGRYNNFCDASSLTDYYSCTFSRDEAVRFQRLLEVNYGVMAGPSAGASFWLANEVRKTARHGILDDRQVAFIAADGRLSETSLLDLAPLRQGRAARLLSELD
jgi:cysteine synthase